MLNLHGTFLSSATRGRWSRMAKGEVSGSEVSAAAESQSNLKTILWK